MEQLVLDGNLRPEERVWVPDEDRWIPAAEVECLKESFESRNRLLALREGSAQGRSTPSIAPILPKVEREEPPSPVRSAPRDAGQAPSSEAGEFLFDPGDLAEEEEAVDPPLPSPAPTPATPQPSRASPPWNSFPSSKAVPKDDAPAEGLGILIPFPEPARSRPQGRPGILGSQVLNPNVGETPVLDARELSGSSSRNASPFRLAWPRLRVVIPTLLLCAGTLSLARYYVRHEARERFVPVDPLGRTATIHPVEAKAATPAVKSSPAEATPPSSLPPPVASPYDAMVAELRERMNPGIVPVESSEGLGTSLLVELSRLKVEATRVKAPILRWGGANGDIPLQASVDITFQSPRGEIDRELTAIGLVIGKYVRHYDLEIPDFSVTLLMEGKEPLKREMNYVDARALYLSQISAVRFLTGKDLPLP
jgi:hypothetical protein